MAKKTLISATTSAVAASAAPEFDTGNMASCMISASNLGALEECDIQLYVGDDTFVAYTTLNGAVKLTNSLLMQELPVGPRYRVLKDATASACEVIIQFTRNGT